MTARTAISSNMTKAANLRAANGNGVADANSIVSGVVINGHSKEAYTGTKGAGADNVQFLVQAVCFLYERLCPLVSLSKFKK